MGTPDKSNTAKNLFDRDTDRDADESDRERDSRDSRDLRLDRQRNNDDKALDYNNKEMKDRDRENSDRQTVTAATAHAEHSSNKRRRKNSSNCDNSLISTFNANVQERHYSQDSQVRIIRLLFDIFHYHHITLLMLIFTTDLHHNL